LCRLMDLLDEFQTTTTERIEIRVGIPRRVIVKVPCETLVIDGQLTTGTADRQERDNDGFLRRGRSRNDC
jgi:hypothetical protein